MKKDPSGFKVRVELRPCRQVHFPDSFCSSSVRGDARGEILGGVERRSGPERDIRKGQTKAAKRTTHPATTRRQRRRFLAGAAGVVRSELIYGIVGGDGLPHQAGTSSRHMEIELQVGDEDESVRA